MWVDSTKSGYLATNISVAIGHYQDLVKTVWVTCMYVPARKFFIMIATTDSFIQNSPFYIYNEAS